jgi:hypothetical protein
MVGAGVTIRGAGRDSTTVRSSSVDGVLELVGESDITICNLTVESTATAANETAIGIIGTYAARQNFVNGNGQLNVGASPGTGMQKQISIFGCRIKGTDQNAIRFPLAVEQLTISDNIVEDCSTGISIYAPDVTTELVSNQISVCRNKFTNVGGVNIQLFSSNAWNVYTINGVQITENDLRDFSQTGPGGVANPGGAIPIEPNGGVKNLVVSNNIIDGLGTNGISMANCLNVTCTGNIVRNQTNYAFELNGGIAVNIVGNVVENCGAFVQETTSVEGAVLSDIIIANLSGRGDKDVEQASKYLL